MINVEASHMSQKWCGHLTYFVNTKWAQGLNWISCITGITASVLCCFSGIRIPLDVAHHFAPIIQHGTRQKSTHDSNLANFYNSNSNVTSKKNKHALKTVHDQEDIKGSFERVEKLNGAFV